VTCIAIWIPIEFFEHVLFTDITYYQFHLYSTNQFSWQHWLSRPLPLCCCILPSRQCYWEVYKQKKTKLHQFVDLPVFSKLCSHYRQNSWHASCNGLPSWNQTEPLYFECFVQKTCLSDQFYSISYYKWEF